LPFHISFIANIARKRPELNRGKTRLGNDFIEVKTITPFKQTDEVTVKLSGNFNKLLVVRINENFEVSSKLVDRKSLPKTKRDFVRVKWGDLEPVLVPAQ